MREPGKKDGTRHQCSVHRDEQYKRSRETFIGELNLWLKEVPDRPKINNNYVLYVAAEANSRVNQARHEVSATS